MTEVEAYKDILINILLEMHYGEPAIPLESRIVNCFNKHPEVVIGHNVISKGMGVLFNPSEFKMDLNSNFIPIKILERDVLIEGLRRLLRFTGCPDILMDNPELLNGKPTKETFEWANKIVEKYKSGK